MRRKHLFLLGLTLLLAAPTAQANMQSDAVQRRREARLALLHGETAKPTIVLRTRNNQNKNKEKDATIIFQRESIRPYTRPSVRDLRKTARIQTATEERGTRGQNTATEQMPTGDVADLKRQVFDLTNAERATANLPAYTYNGLLEKSAQAYAEDLWKNGYFSHTGLDGTMPKDRMITAGYGNLTEESCNCRGYRIYFGENLAKGQTSPQQAVQDWMNSPPHREAVLHEFFTEIGIGIFQNVWVQNFGHMEVQY